MPPSLSSSFSTCGIRTRVDAKLTEIRYTAADMLPEEWPIAAEAADRTAPARHAGGDRLSTVRADFFLNPTERLTEQEGALMTAMLHCLIGDIADELRAALPNGARAANDESNASLVEFLSSSGVLDRP